MSFSYEVIKPENIDEYVVDFRSLEKGIVYPLENGNGSFYIDHGSEYHPFFTQQGSKVRFVVIKDKNEIIGTAAGIWKTINMDGIGYNGLYAADLKIKKDFRGKKIFKKLMWRLFLKWPIIKDYQGWDFCFFCTMLKNGIGVEKSFKGITPAKLVRHSGMIYIYMVEPEKINSLNFLDMPNVSYNNPINLSPERNELVLWNNGKKDIINSQGKGTYKFGHLNPEMILSHDYDKIKKAILSIANKGGIVCFGIDERQSDIIRWFESMKISTKTRCKVFSFSPFAPSMKNFDNIFISTGEI